MEQTQDIPKTKYVFGIFCFWSGTCLNLCQARISDDVPCRLLWRQSKGAA